LKLDDKRRIKKSLNKQGENKKWLT
jgi:hypothetical protein